MPAEQASLSGFVSCLIKAGVRSLVANFPAVSPAGAQAVMREVADELCRGYAGREIYVPAARAQQLQVRNALILQRYHQDGARGVPAKSAARIRQLADEFELTARQVRSILGSTRPSGAAPGSQPTTQQGRQRGRKSRNPS